MRDFTKWFTISLKSEIYLCLVMWLWDDDFLVNLERRLVVTTNDWGSCWLNFQLRTNDYQDFVD